MIIHSDFKIEHGSDDDSGIPVYEGEILDEDEFEDKDAWMVKRNDKLPEEKTAYRLGKTAGSLIAILGFINELRHVLAKRAGRESCINGSGTGKSRSLGGRRRTGGLRRMKRFGCRK